MRNPKIESHSRRSHKLLALSLVAARYALGGIRILNGALGLLTPAVIIRRFGDKNPERNAAALYGLRLFGVRTIVLGADLFLLRRRELDGAIRSAVLIHDGKQDLKPFIPAPVS